MYSQKRALVGLKTNVLFEEEVSRLEKKELITKSEQNNEEEQVYKNCAT